MEFKCRRFTSKYLDTFKFCINTDILEQKKKEIVLFIIKIA